MKVQPAIAGAASLPILQVGDFVSIRGTKDVGRVTTKNCFSYAVCVFGDTKDDKEFAPDLLEMWTPSPRRQFKFGDVRIVGKRSNGHIGWLSEDNGNEEEDRPYTVILYEGDGPDENFSASELIPWVPVVGDRVTELHSDGNEVGIILANDGSTSHVQWRTMKDAPYWPNIRLEPAHWGGDLAGG
jgi:hypothetical protein